MVKKIGIVFGQIGENMNIMQPPYVRDNEMTEGCDIPQHTVVFFDMDI